MIYRCIYGQCWRSLAMNRITIYISIWDFCVKLLVLFRTETDNIVFTGFPLSYVNIFYPSNWTVFKGGGFNWRGGLCSGCRTKRNRLDLISSNVLYVYHISDCVTHPVTCKQGYLTLPTEGTSCFRCSDAKHGTAAVTNLSIQYLSWRFLDEKSPTFKETKD
jgi:hypothetical protein